jgi:hypothetical protein
MKNLTLQPKPDWMKSVTVFDSQQLVPTKSPAIVGLELLLKTIYYNVR